MYLKRNKETGIVESFEDNGNIIGEIISFGDFPLDDEEKESGDQQKTRPAH